MPLRCKTSFAPIPERSKIVGEPNAPADKITSFVARTVRGDLSAPGITLEFWTYSAPVAFPPLDTLG